ncbi:hypothetical protein [Halosimplex sp. TS25]|uniref:hypothetical protein n=1 Tax=Halosimplex rarum TaxID=3396619 RepID=UPI0039EADAE4
MAKKALLGLAALVGGSALYDRYRTSLHDRVVKQTFNTVDRHTDESASIYVDHVDDEVDADGNAQGVLDTAQVPDLIVEGFDNKNLIVEVDTAEALEDDLVDCAAQIRDFAMPGYKRVLVTDDTVVGEKFVDEQGLDGVAVATSSSVRQYL